MEVQKTVTGKILQRTKPKEREVYQKDNGTYQAFVMMELPIGKAVKALMSKLKQNDEMYRRFRASEAFEKMKELVEEYEEEKNRNMTQEEGMESTP